MRALPDRPDLRRWRKQREHPETATAAPRDDVCDLSIETPHRARRTRDGGNIKKLLIGTHVNSATKGSTLRFFSNPIDLHVKFNMDVYGRPDRAEPSRPEETATKTTTPYESNGGTIP